MIVDCAIVGGGPAGLNAALLLGRARRSVILFDDNKPRNAVTRHMHGFLTRDGVSPDHFRALAWQDIVQYPGVKIDRNRVISIWRVNGGFQLQTAGGDGGVFYARKLILATGLKESLPEIPYIHSFYGRSLFSCPYCDGWELRDKPLVIIAEGENAFTLTRLAYQWSKDILLCTNGSNELRDNELSGLRHKGIVVSHERIASLVGEDGILRGLRFVGGREVQRTGGFVSPYWKQASHFAESLGCLMNENGGIHTDGLGRTSVFGVYAAGDNSIIAPAQASIAAGEGSKAAIGVNADLVKEDFV
ncbi:NAD(P)/FAD-dependent oxidoreductase [Paenibacillus sp. GSMTC-2017]|uniref:NAD(P)/FAD-dependent oxidoreductase n=1 Tax=Paenibacillus sp. GSMTC-2017 TaxID=2794350 RepID=UPI0018D974C0|nr:NAD(P)/FAD-dependent oxidoreductase [Paenibacillus sp. GSMTC-2017]MBH5319761.1 NAD(P)/FAD-dependent oxidoreductase [Paenibacillus sp. GSMTC-2017]